MMTDGRARGFAILYGSWLGFIALGCFTTISLWYAVPIMPAGLLGAAIAVGGMWFGLWALRFDGLNRELPPA